jgi:hypothetical protein
MFDRDLAGACRVVLLALLLLLIIVFVAAGLAAALPGSIALALMARLWRSRRLERSPPAHASPHVLSARSPPVLPAE